MLSNDAIQQIERDIRGPGYGTAGEFMRYIRWLLEDRKQILAVQENMVDGLLLEQTALTEAVAACKSAIYWLDADSIGAESCLRQLHAVVDRADQKQAPTGLPESPKSPR